MQGRPYLVRFTVHLVESLIRNQIQQGGDICFSKAVLQVVGPEATLICLAEFQHAPDSVFTG